MTFLTKFPRTKLFTVLVSFMATAIVWSALAWPDWTAANTDNAWGVQDPQVAALQARAELPPEQLAALAEPELAPAPEEPAPRQVIRQTVVIRRTVPGPTYIIPDDVQSTSDTEYVVADTASDAGDLAAQAPAAPAPSKPSAPAPAPAAARPSAPPPAPSAPAPKPAPAPAAPPPPAPKPAPAPAPAPPPKTKAS
mgnify:CR=1 FL=1